MTQLRRAASVLLVGIVAFGAACKPKPTVVGLGHIQEPPGFGRATPFYRADAGGGDIIVDVAVGQNAQIVNLSGTPPGGADVALAWISNTGASDEKRYHFKPNSAATYILYWRASGGYRIEEDMVHGPTNPTWKTGQFAHCDIHNAGIPDVGFKDCNGGSGGGPASSTPVALKTSSMTGGLISSLYGRVLALLEKPFDPPSVDSPGWAACTDGCCSW